MKYLITFMSTGGLIVEADSEAEARRIFEADNIQELAAQELKMNGIDISDIQSDIFVEDDPQNAKLEKLKTALYMIGPHAIEDFCGYEINPSADKNSLDIMTNIAYTQMPDDIFDAFYERYVPEYARFIAVHLNEEPFCYGEDRWICFKALPDFPITGEWLQKYLTEAEICRPQACHVVSFDEITWEEVQKTYHPYGSNVGHPTVDTWTTLGKDSGVDVIFGS